MKLDAIYEVVEEFYQNGWKVVVSRRENPTHWWALLSFRDVFSRGVGADTREALVIDSSAPTAGEKAMALMEMMVKIHAPPVDVDTATPLLDDALASMRRKRLHVTLKAKMQRDGEFGVVAMFDTDALESRESFYIPQAVHVFLAPGLMPLTDKVVDLVIGTVHHLPLPLRSEGYYRGFSENEKPFPWSPQRCRWSTAGYTLPQNVQIPCRQSALIRLALMPYIGERPADILDGVEVEMRAVAVLR